MTVVYILVSNERDFYYEQLLLSLYSLRIHNPELNVVVLVDNTTKESLCGYRAKIKEYVTEIKVVDVPHEYSPKERSRFIKTSFRRYLRGDLLFIDTDTIVTGNLSDVITVDADVACVLDYHSTLDKQIDGKKIVERIKNLFDYDISAETRYYNSGIIFVRDTSMVHELFEKWYDYWKHAAFNKNQCYDQPALMMADIKCGHVIKELKGIYNCQILTSIQYLHKAKIIHFFNNHWEGKEEFSPFFQNELYADIKKTGDISSSTKALISDCKSSFCSPTYYVCANNVKFNNTLVCKTMYSLYKKNGILYKLIKSLCAFRYNIALFIGRTIKK